MNTTGVGGRTIRDRVECSKTFWNLYKTDRKKFVEYLIDIDGPEWPKYAYTKIGQSFRVDDDGFMWFSAG